MLPLPSTPRSTPGHRPRWLRRAAAAGVALCALGALVGWKFSAGATVVVDTTDDRVDGTTTNLTTLLANRGRDGRISLREAVLATNGTSGTDTVSLPAGSYLLTLGELSVTGTLTITGAGLATTVIDAGNASRIFSVGNSRLTLTGMTLRNGRAATGNGGAISKGTGTLPMTNVLLTGHSAPNGNGGAVASLGGMLTWTNVTVSDSTAGQSGGALHASAGAVTFTRVALQRNVASNGVGGALSLAGTRAVIRNSLIDANRAGSGNGGAIAAAYTSSTASQFTTNVVTGNQASNGSGGALSITGNNAWTMSDNLWRANTAQGSGGALLVGNGGNNTALRNTFDNNHATNGSGGALHVAHTGSQSTTMTNVTVHANRANTGAGVSVASGTASLVNVTVALNAGVNGAGGLLHSGGTLRTLNTLVAANTGGLGNCAGTITTTGFNLDSGNTCGFTGTGDLRNAPAGLGSFGNNGGVTPTLSLLLSSAAINAGTASGAPTTDQRGLGRQGTTDIGAFEFGAGTTGAAIRGVVFEDMNYGGGAGRDWAAALAEGGTGRTAVRVELYDGGGNFLRAATTDANGTYAFTFLPAGAYQVRVVNGTVRSNRTGASPLQVPVQTFRTDATTGTPVAVTDRVGGQDPAQEDPDDGSTTLAALAGGGLAVQSLAPVQLGALDITGVDFGYSFNVVVNANDAGQGSLRQFVDNATALNDSGLAIDGRTAGIDHAVFMLPDGTARPGSTAAYASAFSSGVASIALSDTITVGAPMVIDANTQAGWSGRPLLVITASHSIVGAHSLALNTGVTLRGVVINRSRGWGLVLTGDDNVVQGVWLGLNNAGTAASANANGGVLVTGGRNTIGGTAAGESNVIAGNTGDGIQLQGVTATGNRIVNNLIGRNAADTATVPNTRHGIYLVGGASANAIGGVLPGEGNTIRGNGSQGVRVEGAGTVRNAILGNRIAGQRGLGIDLALDRGNAGGADGVKSDTEPNRGMDTPTFTSVALSAESLTVAGHVGSAPGQAPFGGSRVEIFAADVAAAGAGQGDVLLGVLTADSDGRFKGKLVVPAEATVTAGGLWITGTATDGDGNTSEFGTNRIVLPLTPAVEYPFAETTGSIANDAIGNEHLTIASASSTTSWGGGRLTLRSSTIAASAAAPAGLIGACMSTGEITIEARVSPANTTQTGPARIISLSADSNNRNFTLGQDGGRYAVRLRTTATNANGFVSAPNLLETAAGTATSASTHVVFTRASDGATRLYLNGAVAASGTVGGDFSGWNTGYRLMVGNELTNDRPWLGGLEHAAVFCRALSQEEVAARVGRSLAGTVFEDIQYGGGAGRSRLASGGAPVVGARVELYNSGGALVDAMVTGADGGYRFAGLAPGRWWVRVATQTVRSTRANNNDTLRGVLTWRTDARSGTVQAAVDQVGGTNPAIADAGSAAAGTVLDTASGVFSAGLVGTAQALAPVQLGAANLEGIDFGFNFNTVVNANDLGQGSLRQAIVNANTLGGDSTLALAGQRLYGGVLGNLEPGRDHIVFMVPDGTARPGLRAGLASGLVAGRVRVVLASALPALAAGTVLDGATQTANVADSLAGQVGSGGTVGVGGTALARFDQPEVELDGNHALSVSGASAALRAVALRRGTVRLGAANTEVSDTLVGLAADGTSDATTVPSGRYGIDLTNAAGLRVRHNLVRVNDSGIRRDAAGGTVTIEFNEVAAPATGHTNAFDGLILSSGTNDLIRHNLVRGQQGAGYEVPFGGGTNLVVEENTFSANGMLGSIASNEPGGIVITTNANTTGPQITLRRNVITGNGGPGVHIGSGARRVLLTQNSIFGNGAGGVTGLGIDLDDAVRDANNTNPPQGVTANTGTKLTSRSNEGMNHPVFTSAALAAGSVAVAGFVGSAAGQVAFGGAVVEVFVSDDNPTGHGAGRTFVGSVTAQADGRFAGTLAVPVGVTLVSGSTRLTATARDASGNTSEFGRNITVGAALSGLVFEDANYGGGAGRSQVAGGGVARPGARVEIYTVSGGVAAFAQATTTASDGTYRFFGLNPGSYMVRVQSSTVTSSRPGARAGQLPVVTFAVDGTGGSAVPRTDVVGGSAPAATAGAAVPGAPGTTQAMPYASSEAHAEVTLSAGDLPGVDFGFSFTTVTNTNDSGAGSLRQVLTNANALGGDAALAVAGRAAGVEHVVFMIGNGSAAPGLRSTINFFNGGVATFAPVTALPTITTTMVIDAQMQAGWSAAQPRPVLQINGSALPATANGLSAIDAPALTLRGLIVNRVGGPAPSGGRAVSIVRGNGHVVQGNWIGLDGTGMAAARRGDSASDSFGQQGLLVQDAPDSLVGGSTAAQRNIVAGAGSTAIDVTGSHRVRVQGNWVGLDATGTAAINPRVNVGVSLRADQATVGGSIAAERNLFAGAGQGGVSAAATMTGTRITGNWFGFTASGAPLAGMGSGSSGIYIAPDTRGVRVGGAVSGEGNVFGGHAVAIDILGHAGTPTSDITIQGNLIGLAPDGGTAHANTTAGVRLGQGVTGITIGGTGAGEGNRLSNGPVGVLLAANAGAGNRVLGNAIWGHDGLGIDLGGDGVTLNDGAVTPSAPNLLMDHAVIATAWSGSTNVTVSGHVGPAPGRAQFAGARVELFTSDGDASGFGEGIAFIGALTADAGGAFSGTLTLPAGVTVTAGTTRLVATATDSAGNTSEFGPHVLIGTLISGTVFEDVNYGGGVGRDRAAALAGGGGGVTGARVELYRQDTGAFVAAATTDATGAYSLSAPSGGTFTYLVRVATDTVPSRRSGWVSGVRPVMTFRVASAGGANVDVGNNVGGAVPGAQDSASNLAGEAWGTLFVSATEQPHAFSTVQVTAGSARSGIDFGFAFHVVVNTRDSNTGSLRQALDNANALGGDAALAINGRTTGVEHIVFMLADGTSRPGLTNAYASMFSSSVATLRLASLLPAVTTPMVLDARTQPGWTGRPLVEIDGSAQGGGAAGGTLRVTSTASVTIGGLALTRAPGHGLLVDGGRAIVVGNHIGVDASGSGLAGNAGDGIHLRNALSTQIGGTDAADRNVVGGNGGDGIRVVGGTGTVVQGNHVGIGADGLTALGNAGAGVRDEGPATTLWVGGPDPGAGNVISGNAGDGVRLQGSGVLVQGNRIGLDASGSLARPNAGAGVWVRGSDHILGGGGSAEGNLIGGNRWGVVVDGASNTWVAGNRVGLNAAGTGAVGNFDAGIRVVAAAVNTRIGGTTAGERNVIGGNGRDGTDLDNIVIDGAGSGTVVTGNYIGTLADGIALPTANGAAGIVVRGGGSLVVGGVSAGERNLIAGNGSAGIYVGPDMASVVVRGNWIGQAADGGTFSRGASHGVWVDGANVTIGGTLAGEGNVVRGAVGAGLLAQGWTGNSPQMRALGNSIFGNGALGIDLLGDGVTLNDGAQTVGQPNRLMDHPVITAARARGSALTLAGYVGSAAGQSAFAGARVEIFASDVDSSGFGEGRSLLGSVTTDGAGNFSATITLPVAMLAAGTRLTGTATDAAGHTSEFGANFEGLVVEQVVNHNGDAGDANPGDGLCATSVADQCTLRAALMEANAWANPASMPTIAFALPGCTAPGQAACRIAPASTLPAVTATVLVDATTQPSYAGRPVVELSGASAGSGIAGLRLQGASQGVRGLIINRFSGSGVTVAGSGHAVVGNWIGLAPDGRTAAGNGAGGINVTTGVAAHLIGGATAADRNVISGNGGAGVRTDGTGTGGVRILGNHIGTDADGLAAVPGSHADALIVDSPGVVIGAPGAGNLITGATSCAVWISSRNGSGTVVQGNRIGESAAGAALPIPVCGISVDADDVTIGGTGAGQANTIRATGGEGVRVRGRSGSGTTSDAARVRISANRIFGTVALGIDLRQGNLLGITPNDGAVNAGQPNNGIDHPVITSAGVADDARSVVVGGHVGTGTGQSVFAGARVEIFRSDGDPSGYGDGAEYLGALTVDANGRFSGTLPIAVGQLAVGNPLTGTTIDPVGNTSEFGPNYTTTTTAALVPGRFDVFESDTAGGSLSGPLRTKVAGVPATVAVVASNPSGTGLHSGFSGTVALSWLDARDDSGPADAGGCRSSWTTVGAAGAAGSAVFVNASRAAAVVVPPVAGTRVMRLRLTHTPLTGSPVSACSGDAFAVRPATLAAVQVGNASDLLPGLARSLATVTANGGVVHRAGRPFSVRATASSLAGTVTGYSGAPDLAIQDCLLPAGCTPGTLGAESWTASAGIVSTDSARYSEVGAIRIRLVDERWADIDAADTPLADRRIESDDIGVGRFVPDRYDVELLQPGVLAAAQATCSAPGAAYTFFGQAFGWATPPQWQVTARNAAGDVVRHWTGTLMKLDAARHVAAALSASAVPSVALSASFGMPTLADQGDGTVRVAASGADVFVLGRGSTPRESTSPTFGWASTLNDDSEVAVAGNGALSATLAQAGVPFASGGTFHTGRVRVSGAHGDMRRGVRALVELQRFSSAGWTRLTDDNGCVTLPAQAFSYLGGTGRFAGTGNQCAAPLQAGVTLAGGRGWLVLPRSPGNLPGSVRLQLNLGPSAGGPGCTPAGAEQPASALNLPHLRGGWGGVGHLDADPQALMTWGLAERDFVLRRERFQ